jgi:hypothetical protein
LLKWKKSLIIKRMQRHSYFICFDITAKKDKEFQPA